MNRYIICGLYICIYTLNRILVPFSHSVMSNSLQPLGLKHTRLLCPSPTPRLADTPGCPSSWWWYPTLSSAVAPFFSCLQSFPASGSFPMAQFSASGGQSIGVSASESVLPMNSQCWFPLGLTGLKWNQSLWNDGTRCHDLRFLNVEF